MNWWGKVIGASVGLFMGGPFGALLGGILGHAVDSAVPEFVDVGRIQDAFFTTLFSVMGHLAKADGRVSEREIQVAEAVMDRMQLNNRQRREAIRQFNRGKTPGFPLRSTIDEFFSVARQQPALSRLLVEFLLDAALADGVVRQEPLAVLLTVCAGLGIPQWEFERILAMRQGAAGFRTGGWGGAQGQGRQAPPPRRRSQGDPYRVLGVGREASDREVKQAYRRLISQHHPDKLVSKGLPPEMMELAKERSAEISAAYDEIRKRRGVK